MAEWITWTGAARPVARDTIVDVKLDDGRVVNGLEAWTIDEQWKRTAEQDKPRIVGYRISDAPETRQ